MKGAALRVGEIIAFVVRDKVDNHSLGQACRLVDNQPPLLHARPDRTHATTLRVSKVLGKRPTKAACDVREGPGCNMLRQ
jgi:hypothetical protein